MPTDASRRLRADAARNSERILRAAREVYAESGPEAMLEDITRPMAPCNRHTISGQSPNLPPAARHSAVRARRPQAFHSAAASSSQSVR